MIGLLTWHAPPSKRQQDSKGPQIDGIRGHGFQRSNDHNNPGNIGGEGGGGGGGAGGVTRPHTTRKSGPSDPAETPDGSIGGVTLTIFPPSSTDLSNIGPNQGGKTKSRALETPVPGSTDINEPPFPSSRTRNGNLNGPPVETIRHHYGSSQSDSSGSSGAPAGTIAAAVVVPIVFIAALVAFIFFFLRRRRRRQRGQQGHTREVKGVPGVGDPYDDGPVYRDNIQMPPGGMAPPQAYPTAVATVPSPNAYYGGGGENLPITSAVPVAGMPPPQQPQQTPRALQAGYAPPPSHPNSGSYLLGEDIGGGKGRGASPFSEDGEGGGAGGDAVDNDDAVSNISASEGVAHMPADQMSAVSDLSYQGDLRPGQSPIAGTGS